MRQWRSAISVIRAGGRDAGAIRLQQREGPLYIAVLDVINVASLLTAGHGSRRCALAPYYDCRAQVRYVGV